MCWYKMPKIQVPSVAALNNQNASSTALTPESPKTGVDKSWDVSSKKKGVSALRVDPVTKEDALQTSRDIGVNY